jgi:hypothetical protein
MFDPVSRRILGEMQGIHREMRDMRVDMREMRVEMREMRVDMRAMMRDFRRDAARRDAAIMKVGLTIAKTLDQHTTILLRIDKKLGTRGNGGPGNGRGL